MDLLLAGQGEVLLVAGQENNWSHQQRVDGFQAEAAANFPGLNLLPPQTCGDDQQLAHDIVCRAVQGASVAARRVRFGKRSARCVSDAA